mgnify:FL=1|jgi:two-component system sensor histidine kinase DesK
MNGPARKRFWSIAPDSPVAQDMRAGRPPWLPFVHLVWTAWVFLTPMFAGGGYGYTKRWALLTLLSYPLFVALYVVVVTSSERRARQAAWGMVALCLALLPWYPSGLSYFVFGSILLRPCRGGGSVAGYLALLAVLNALLLAWARYLDYPWQSVLWMPVVSAIIGMLGLLDRINQEREAMLRMSQDEVRRLAALAERERIGRDLHDLLGHTLSMVALKSDLAARLLERDPAAARGEIAAVSRVAREALAQVRRAVSGIRAAGIAAELASAKLLLESDGVAFEYRVDESLGTGTLPPEVESAFALAVREAATNIQRHARARRAGAGFAIEDGEAVLRISDDGRGGAIVPGNGLTGMRERIEGLGGRLRIESGKDGTRIEARIPLAGAPATGTLW